MDDRTAKVLKCPADALLSRSQQLEQDGVARRREKVRDFSLS